MSWDFDLEKIQIHHNRNVFVIEKHQKAITTLWQKKKLIEPLKNMIPYMMQHTEVMHYTMTLLLKN